MIVVIILFFISNPFVNGYHMHIGVKYTWYIRFTINPTVNKHLLIFPLDKYNICKLRFIFLEKKKSCAFTRFFHKIYSDTILEPVPT